MESAAAAIVTGTNSRINTVGFCSLDSPGRLIELTKIQTLEEMLNSSEESILSQHSEKKLVEATVNIQRGVKISFQYAHVGLFIGLHPTL